MLLAFAFTDELEPPCLAACDANGDGVVTGVLDAMYILAYAFLGRPAPPSPFPDCGEGALESDARLGCRESPPQCQ